METKKFAALNVDRSKKRDTETIRTLAKTVKSGGDSTKTRTPGLHPSLKNVKPFDSSKEVPPEIAKEKVKRLYENNKADELLIEKFGEKIIKGGHLSPEKRAEYLKSKGITYYEDNLKWLDSYGIVGGSKTIEKTKSPTEKTEGVKPQDIKTGRRTVEQNKNLSREQQRKLVGLE